MAHRIGGPGAEPSFLFLLADIEEVEFHPSFFIFQFRGIRCNILRIC